MFKKRTMNRINNCSCCPGFFFTAALLYLVGKKILTNPRFLEMRFYSKYRERTVVYAQNSTYHLLARHLTCNLYTTCYFNYFELLPMPHNTQGVHKYNHIALMNRSLPTSIHEYATTSCCCCHKYMCRLNGNISPRSFIFHPLLFYCFQI